MLTVKTVKLPMLLILPLASLTLFSCSSTETPNKSAIEEGQTTTNDGKKSETLRLAVASNLAYVMPLLINNYEEVNNLLDSETDVNTDIDRNLNIDITYGSSGTLYAQIVNGAPYDVFLSANQDFPAKLYANHSTDAKPFTYAQGQLALYSTVHSFDSTTPFAVASLTDTPSLKVTIANPELAPYGASSQAYLESSGIYGALQKNKQIIQAQNIGQAFQFVQTGSVDYGWVAQSQIVASKIDSRQYQTLDVDTYPAILQDGIVLSEHPMASQFADYLQSVDAQRILSQAGYIDVTDHTLDIQNIKDQEIASQPNAIDD